MIILYDEQRNVKRNVVVVVVASRFVFLISHKHVSARVTTRTSCCSSCWMLRRTRKIIYYVRNFTGVRRQGGAARSRSHPGFVWLLIIEHNLNPFLLPNIVTGDDEWTTAEATAYTTTTTTRRRVKGHLHILLIFEKLSEGIRQQ